MEKGRGDGDGNSRLLSASGRNRLLVGTAMLGSLVAGYGRRAYAQCAPTAPFSGVYNCSGALTTTQLLVGTPLSVTTTPGFSIVTTAGDAFTLAGDTGLTFTDNNASTITGAQNGINAYLVGSSTGNIVITTSGPVTVRRTASTHTSLANFPAAASPSRRRGRSRAERTATASMRVAITAR